MQELQVDDAGNVWAPDGQGGYRLVQQAGGQQGQIFTPPVDPVAAGYAAADEQRKAASAARDSIEFTERNKPNLPTGYMLGSDGRSAVRIPGVRLDGDPAPKAEEDMAAVRAEALDKIRLARSLQQRSRDGWFTTGVGSSVAGMFRGSPAYDLAQDTDTLKNAGALTRIMEMSRQNGGKNPLTPLSNSDFQALANSLTNLDPGQSDAQYQGNVQRTIDLYTRAYEGAGGTDLEGALNPTQRGAVPGASGNIRSVRNDDMATFAGAASAPPTSGVSGGVTGGSPSAPGSSFGNASGVAFAKKLSDAYRSGATLNDLNRILADGGFNPITDPDYIRIINNRQPLNFGPPEVDDSRGAIGRALGSVADSAAGAYGISAANALTAGYLDEIAGGQAQLAKEYANERYPGASFAGTLTGGALGMIPAGRLARAVGVLGQGGKAALAGDALYGAAFGSGENNDSRLAGAATGAASALAGGYLGAKAVQGIGRAARGVSDPAVQYLSSRNIPLSLGSLIGNRSPVGKVVNAAESAPLIGGMLGGRRLDSMAAFNREAINDALAPIGQTAQGEIGQEAVGRAQDAVSDAYTTALSGVRVPVDRQFVSDIASPLRAGRDVPVQGEQFSHLMQRKFRPLFGQNRELSGDGVQAAFQTLRKARSGFTREGQMGNLVADEIGAIDDAVNDLVTRQSPGTASALARANEAYSNLQPINAAATSAVNGAAGAGIFTPAQLTRAVTNNTRSYGGKAAAARGAKQTPLMTAAQDVLPSTVPNSGTADRLSALALPAAFGGGAYSLSDVSPEAAAGLALLAATTSRPGARALQAAAVKRPTGTKKVGDALVRNARLGGIFGAPLALTYQQ